MGMDLFKVKCNYIFILSCFQKIMSFLSSVYFGGFVCVCVCICFLLWIILSEVFVFVRVLS